MPQKQLSRIWTDFTTLLMPLLAMAAYVLGWSPMVKAALTILCFTGIYGTRLAMTDRGSRRAGRIARGQGRTRRWRGRWLSP